MASYTWKVLEMTTVPSLDGLTDVVKSVRALFILRDDSGEEVSKLFAVDLPSADSSNFTAYSSLTESNVISWISSLVDVEAEKVALQSILQERLNPVLLDTTVIKRLPWL